MNDRITKKKPLANQGIGITEDRRYSILHRAVALLYGIACHSIFLAAIASMAIGLYTGMAIGIGKFSGWPAVIANLGLILQFPLVHSLMLSRPGRMLLERLAPFGLGRDLSTTIFAIMASLQLLSAFLLWSPSGIVWFNPQGALRIAFLSAYAFSWLLLVKSLFDADIALQSGSLGWWSVFRGRRPQFKPFPTGGLFQACRQPIYFSFSLILWTAPEFTPDRVVLASAWTIYCLIGPVFKEQRFFTRYGNAFRAYQAKVPYWLPRFNFINLRFGNR